MQMPAGEFIDVADTEIARGQIAEAGHVGLSGLYEPGLADQALEEVRSRFVRWRNRRPGVSVGQISSVAPKELALSAIISGIREGAVMLGYDLTPGHSEKAQYDLIDMEKGARGPVHQDGSTLLGVVAATNLMGRSSLWFEGENDGVTYQLQPGLVVIHDLAKDLVHRGSAGDENRIGLAVARRPR